MPRNRIPSYRLHKPTGQAVVTLGGKDHYLGRYGTQESRERYDQLIARYLIEKGKPPVLQPASDLTVKAVLARWLEQVRGPEGPYWKRGQLTGQVDRIQRALAVARKFYGDLPADSFGPAELKVLRRWMLTEAPRRRPGQTGLGWSWSFSRACVNVIKQCWAWAAGEGLVPAEQAMRLRLVKATRKNAPGVRPHARVKAVEWETFQRTLPAMHGHLADLARVQYLACLRPCEVAAMRPRDIDLDGRLPDGSKLPGVWVYLVPEHANKNAHHGATRLVCVGPQAQAILLPYLDGRERDKPLFSPAEAVRSWLQLRGRSEHRGPAREPGEAYTTSSYGHAIAKACKRAQVERWSPNQLRHLRATEIRSRFGADAARVCLGHALPGVTGVYAEPDWRKAAKVMRRIG